MKHRWTAEDHATVVAEYATADLVRLAKSLGRTVAAVKRHAQTSGIKRPRHSTKGYRYMQRNPRPRAVPATPWRDLQLVIAAWRCA